MVLESFLNPRSIAIIGASSKPGKVGYALAKKLQAFQGEVFFVNKNCGSIFGRGVVPSVLEIKEDVDLGIIAVPAVAVPQVVEECGRKGIRAVIVISAGFAEAGNVRKQRELVGIAKKFRMRLLGPNCFGVVNTSLNLDATFARLSPMKGSVSLVSQSGALWSTIAEYSRAERLGFGKVVTLGDAADVDFCEVIEYLERDKQTRVIVLYIEALSDGRKFMRVVQKCKKPVIALKAGKSDAGMRAALSHTGSLAGSYEVYKAAFKQSGALVAESLSEALDVARYCSLQSFVSGKRVVVVTNAGGPGILVVDALRESGFEIVALPRKVKEKLPKAWSGNNPIDVLGDADELRYRLVFEALAKNAFFDGVVVVLTPQFMVDPERVAREVVIFSKKVRKPVVCCFMGFESVESAREVLEKNNVPCFFDPERVARVLGKLKE